MRKNNVSKLERHIEKVSNLLKNRLSIVFTQTMDIVVEIEKLKYEILPKSGIYDLDSDFNDFCEEKLITWSPGLGFRKLYDVGVCYENLKKYELAECIKEMAYSGGGEKRLLVIEDLHYLFDRSNFYYESNVDVAAAFLEFYRVNQLKEKEDRSIIIIISQKFNIPQELIGCISTVEAPMPDESDIADELGLKEFPIEVKERIDSCQDIANSMSNFIHIPEGKEYKYDLPFFINVATGQEHFETKRKELISYLVGMSISQIRAILAAEDNDISTLNLNKFKEGKEQLVKDSGLLRIETPDDNYEKRLGDIDGLINYIKFKKIVLDNKIYYNLPLPKGILLVGPPGCGKSETSKAIASILKMPLLSLDMGRLLGNLVGDSEHNFEKALAIAEAAQPCVLWIDEIEKAFAGADSKTNDETMTRILGHLLTWMQEREQKKICVYIVATANDLSTLRPEFLRKGRWDDIFYLTYPNEEGVLKILRSCLAQYGLKLDKDDKSLQDDICKLYSQYNRAKLSGADIKAAVQQTYDKIFNLLYYLKLDLNSLDQIPMTSTILFDALEKMAKKNNDLEINKAIEKEILNIKYQLAVQSPNSSKKLTIEKEKQLRELVKKKTDFEVSCAMAQQQANIKIDLIDVEVSSLTSSHQSMDNNRKINIENKIKEKYELLQQCYNANIKNEIEKAMLDIQISLLSQESCPQDFEMPKDKEDKLRKLLWEKLKQDDRKELEDYYKSMGFQSASDWKEIPNDDSIVESVERCLAAFAKARSMLQKYITKNVIELGENLVNTQKKG